MALVSLDQVGNLLLRKLAELAESGSRETPKTDQARDDLVRLVAVWDFVTGADGEMGRSESAHKMLLEAINRAVPLQSLGQVTDMLRRMMAETETNIRLAIAEWEPNVEGNVGAMDTQEQHKLLTEVINEASQLPQAGTMTVSELFARDCPIVAGFLNNTGGFWPKVKENTISNEELSDAIRIAQIGADFDSNVYKASIRLMVYRLTGVIPNPGNK